MNRRMIVLVGILVLAAIPAIAQTGWDNYHYNASMNCSDCHSMHASAHVLGGAAITVKTTEVDAGPPPLKPWTDGSGVARDHLLKAVGICESCHDGGVAGPDVVGDNDATTLYDRSAGGTVGPGMAGGHQIGNTNPPPGYNSAIGADWYATTQGSLQCVSCHSPHGNANYRNLGPSSLYTGANALTAPANYFPTVTKSTTVDSWSDGTPSDVHIAIAADRLGSWGNAATFNTYYQRDLVKYRRDATGYDGDDGVTASNRMDNFCSICHGQFHGGAKTDTTVGGTTLGVDYFRRHPTGVVLIGALPTDYATDAANAFANLKVYQATNTANSTTDSPGCLTCHKAHGSANPFGLYYPGTAADTATDGIEAGSGGTFKSLCKTCHAQGGNAFP